MITKLLSQKMKVAVMSGVLMLSTACSGAVPTYAQIETAIQNKNYTTANIMIKEVLRKRPESLKAHLINYELMASEGASRDDLLEEQHKIDMIDSGEVLIERPDGVGVRLALTGTIMLLVCLAVVLIRAYLKERGMNKFAIQRENYTEPMSHHSIA